MTQKPAPPIELRARWRFAVFGITEFLLISAVLWTGRATGLVEFWLERLPGELLTAPFGVSSRAVDWVSYFGLGALLGLAYHRVFRYLGRASWELGVLLGVIQWGFFGIAIAFIERFLTYNFTVLPTYSIFSSIEGFFMGWFILILNCLFGGFMGGIAQKPRRQEKEEVVESPARPRTAHKAA